MKNERQKETEIARNHWFTLQTSAITRTEPRRSQTQSVPPTWVTRTQHCFLLSPSVRVGRKLEFKEKPTLELQALQYVMQQSIQQPCCCATPQPPKQLNNVGESWLIQLSLRSLNASLTYFQLPTYNILKLAKILQSLFILKIYYSPK